MAAARTRVPVHQVAEQVNTEAIKPLLHMIESGTGRFWDASTFTTIYHLIYQSCTQTGDHNNSEEMYQLFSRSIQNHQLDQVVPALASAQRHDARMFLLEWCIRWEKQKHIVDALSKLFMLLDRHYIPNTGVLPLRDEGFRIYKDCVLVSFASKVATITSAVESGQDKILLEQVAQVNLEISQHRSSYERSEKLNPSLKSERHSTSNKHATPLAATRAGGSDVLQIVNDNRAQGSADAAHSAMPTSHHAAMPEGPVSVISATVTQIPDSAIPVINLRVQLRCRSGAPTHVHSFIAWHISFDVSRHSCELVAEQLLAKLTIVDTVHAKIMLFDQLQQATEPTRQALYFSMAPVVISAVSPRPMLAMDAAAASSKPAASTLSLSQSAHAATTQLSASLTRIPSSELKYCDSDYIDSGSCGHVYRGLWRERVVAVKKFLLRRALPSSCYPEIRLLHDAAHAHILQVLGVCLDPGHFAMVTEYADQGSMYNFIFGQTFAAGGAQRRILNDQLLLFALDMVKPVAFLHGRRPRIVHRDLNPNNYVVFSHSVASMTSENSIASPLQVCVKLCDFGLARLRHESTRYSEISSFARTTVSYCPPEVLTRGARFTSKSDMYSLGICLLELFTGQPAWQKEAGDAHRIMAHLLQNHAPPLLSNVSEPYRTLIRQCIDPIPALRICAEDVVSCLNLAIDVSIRHDYSRLGFQFAAASSSSSIGSEVFLKRLGYIADELQALSVESDLLSDQAANDEKQELENEQAGLQQRMQQAGAQTLPLASRQPESLSKQELSVHMADIECRLLPEHRWQLWLSLLRTMAPCSSADQGKYAKFLTDAQTREQELKNDYSKYISCLDKLKLVQTASDDLSSASAVHPAHPFEQHEVSM